MSEKDKKVVSLAERREKMNEEAAARGEVFSFEVLEEPDLGVGIDEENHMVILHFDPDATQGYAMTPENARKLAVAVIEAAGFIKLSQEGLIKFPSEPETPR